MVKRNRSQSISMSKKPKMDLAESEQNAKDVKFNEILYNDLLISDDEEEMTPALKTSTSEVSSYIPTRQDLNLVRLTRHNLERFVHMPFFDRIATGCYVRVGIGEINNVSVYAVAEVIGLYETSMVYNLGNTKTNKGVKVRQVNQERERYYRMEFVSNQEFSDEEYLTWVRSNTGAGKGLPSKTIIDQKQADIKEAINYKSKENERCKSKPLNHTMKQRETELQMTRGDKKTVRKRILQENKWFKASPLNVVKNTRIEAMTIRDLKTARNLELPDFKERALQLDKLRTSAYLNDGNSQRKIEKAQQAKVPTGKGITVVDPTSRRATRPQMNLKARDTTSQLALKSPDASSRVELANTTAHPDHRVQASQGISVVDPTSRVTTRPQMNFKARDTTAQLALKSPDASTRVEPANTNHAMKQRETELPTNRGDKKTVRKRIIQENKWFKASPLNVVKNTRIEAMTIRDLKTARNVELPDFKERALQLDKLRTSAYLNDGNSQRKIEKAQQARVPTGKGITVVDPTSRRATRPQMNLKARDTTAQLALKSPDASSRVEPANTTAHPDHVKQTVLPRKLSLADYKRKRGQI